MRLFIAIIVCIVGCCALTLVDWYRAAVAWFKVLRTPKFQPWPEPEEMGSPELPTYKPETPRQRHLREAYNKRHPHRPYPSWTPASIREFKAARGEKEAV